MSAFTSVSKIFSLTSWPIDEGSAWMRLLLMTSSSSCSSLVEGQTLSCWVISLELSDRISAAGGGGQLTRQFRAANSAARCRPI